MWSRKRRFFAAFMILVVAMILVSSRQQNTDQHRFAFRRIFYGSFDSVFSPYRAKRISMTMKILRDHPFCGIGFCHFRLRFDEYYGKKGVPLEFKIPDNMYLSLLAETGIIGLSGFLFFILFIVKKASTFLRRNDGIDKGIIFFPFLALIACLVNMASYDMFYWDNQFILFALLCGFIIGFIEYRDGYKC